LELYPHETQKPNTASVSSGIPVPNRRWFLLAWTSIIGVTLVALLVIRLGDVYSDEGPGTEESAFDSPIKWKYPLGDPAYLVKEPSTPGDLLTNGNMDQMGFYWRPPNHWIAGGWFEWFSREPFNFPEFTDGHERDFYHTYPSSQRLQLWGNDYAGGLMQSVTVAPCASYRFEAYGQSRPGAHPPPPVEVASHMKVGIEPYGWKSGRTIPRYDPGLEPSEFPPTVVWSPEATHDFVFSPYSVTTEALSTTVTTILYSYPEVDIEGGVLWNDTIWDTASLVQVPPPSGTLVVGEDWPEPDDFIRDLKGIALPGVAVVDWETLRGASTQLLYEVVALQEPISMTALISHSLYLPMVTTMIGPSALAAFSPPDWTVVQHHRVTLTGLPSKYGLRFVALSRRLEGLECVTSASDQTRIVTPDGGSQLYAPVVLKGAQTD
jgi:hypothetical protein